MNKYKHIKIYEPYLDSEILLEEHYLIDNNLNDFDDRPAFIEYYPNGNYKKIVHYQKGKKTNYNGPAEITFLENGNKYFEFYYNDNYLHNENGPAFIEYYPNGNKKEEKFYCYGKNSHLKPNSIQYFQNGDIENEIYFHNEKIYEDNIPYIKIFQKNKLYKINYLNENFEKHNEFGPAEIIFDSKGNKKAEFYYFKDKCVSKEEYLLFIKMNKCLENDEYLELFKE